MRAYVGNDHVLKVTGLIDAENAVYKNAATVTVSIVDANGTGVTGQSWPTTLAYATGTNGEYKATIADTVGFSAGRAYTVKVTADAGAGLKGYWEIPLMSEVRTS